MDAFATIDDLNARREVPIAESQTARAQALLFDASVMLATEMRKSGINYENITDEVYLLNLQAVTCSIVNRAIKTENLMGIESRSQEAGPYNYSWEYSNPNDNLYLTASEKRRLGLGNGRLYFKHANIRRRAPWV